jgi:hypothetical protein
VRNVPWTLQDALVKAAKAAERDLRKALSKQVTYSSDWRSADDLSEAIKAFEVSNG